eukprot:CAMPEP_0177646456 /NCGR_PEP_ID=MMETSP0447-20121125/9783_1 /TAXON_ID=0 /ORGANISM="Stygamoeba regulata, Strain BSH-02190019" /LENGTH=1373 /DNA_ID=CAMNT_0019148989 /DNA_START=612 /DNA_END=4733 /DNA_ORIENTATION=+
MDDTGCAVPAGNECAGTCTECASLTDVVPCTSQSGCSASNVCLGDCSCSAIADQSSCEALGCSYEDTCTENLSPCSCSVVSNPDDCNARGCFPSIIGCVGNAQCVSDSDCGAVCNAANLSPGQTCVDLNQDCETSIYHCASFVGGDACGPCAGLNSTQCSDAPQCTYEAACTGSTCTCELLPMGTACTAFGCVDDFFCDGDCTPCSSFDPADDLCPDQQLGCIDAECASQPGCTECELRINETFCSQDPSCSLDSSYCTSVECEACFSHENSTDCLSPCTFLGCSGTCTPCESLNRAMCGAADGCGWCGDGVTDPSVGEQCDDGNEIDGDGCSSTCQNEACNDAIQNNDETDVDCGGASCRAANQLCELGEGCVVSIDCTSACCLPGGTCGERRIVTPVVSPASCAAVSDGAITIAVPDGTSCFWPDLMMDAPCNRSGLATDSYSVQLSSDDYCLGSFVLSVPTLIESIGVTAESTPEGCAATNGYVRLTYEPQIQPIESCSLTSTGPSGVVDSSSITDTHCDFHGLSAGDYVYTVTNVAGCSEIGTVHVNSSVALVPVLSSLIDVSCLGGSDGEITLYNPIGEYECEWADTPSSSCTRASLPAATYTLVSMRSTLVADCWSGSANYLISEPTPYEAEIVITPSYCDANGTVQLLNLTGGQPAPIVTGEDEFFCALNLGKPNQIDSEVCLWLQVPTGNYTVHVCPTSSCCTGLHSVVVPSEPSPIVATVVAIPTCPGETNGRATLFLENAVNPACRWIRKGDSGTILNSGCDSLSNLDRGSYVVFISDERGCHTDVSFQIEVGAATDQDSDGVCDSADNCPTVANPGQQDSDSDGAGNACDPCPFDPDDDADNDGYCVPQDQCPFTAAYHIRPPCGCKAEGVDGQDPDSDGICNFLDNCQLVANPSQSDVDSDGVGDACDPCPTCNLNDGDEDGVCGCVDNCPTSANSDQADHDQDGIGDVCDSCPNDPDNDIDGDGFCADQDECPNNPAFHIRPPCGCETTSTNNVTDSDGDGVVDCLDGCPFDRFKTSPGECGCGFVDGQCSTCDGDDCGTISIDPGDTGSDSGSDSADTVNVIFDGTSTDHTIMVESGSNSDGVSIGVRDIIELRHDNRSHVWSLSFANVTGWTRTVATQVFTDNVRATNVNFTAMVSELYGSQGEVFRLDHPVLVRVANYFFKKPTTYEFLPGVNYTVAANSNKFTVEIHDWPFVHEDNLLLLTTNYTIGSGSSSDCTVSASDTEETSALLTGSGAVVSVSVARHALLDGVLREVSATSLPRQGLVMVESPSFRQSFVYDPNIGLLFGGTDPCNEDDLLFVYLGAGFAGGCFVVAILFSVVTSYWQPARRLFRGAEAIRIDQLRELQRATLANTAATDP